MEKIFFFLIVLGAASAQNCIQCNSNDNSMCATMPGSLMAKSCPFQNSTCYTRINLGQTIRGCTSDLNSTTIESCYMTGTCRTCNRTACNNEIFPERRPSCYQCDNKISSNCSMVSYSSALPCPIYKEDDRCFIYKSTKQNSLSRGCLSSSNNACRNVSQCYVCTGIGCNDLPGNSTMIPNANDAAIRTITSTLLFAALAALFFRLS